MLRIGRYRRGEILTLLMDKCKDSEITKEILEAAANSLSRNKFEPLLARANAHDIVPKDLVHNAAHGNGPGVMMMLLDRYGNTSLTDYARRQAATIGNEDVMQFLLDRGGANATTRNLVDEAAWRGNDRLLRMLLFD